MNTENLRTWAEIDLDALLYNAECVGKQIQSEKLCAVIKANAYGHGAVRVAKSLEQRVDYFAVATAEEAYELRRSGIRTPILILGIVPKGQLNRLIDEEITLTLSNKEKGEEMILAAKSRNKKAKVHIALDTGMGRIGFLANDESVKEIAELAKSPYLEVEGAFSHFARADEEDLSFTEKQMKLFDLMLAKLKKQSVIPPVCHIYNSAAICRLHQHYGMVRQGITLYGISPSSCVDAGDIRPVMSFKSRISHIKTLDAGEPVSYGGTFVTTKKTVVATIPMGYGDGVPRALSQKGSLFICEKKAPILGRVCMDQLMVDVSDIPEATVGSEAELFGKNLSIAAQAALCETIPYELMCNVNIRVPRVYMKAGKVEGIDCALPL